MSDFFDIPMSMYYKTLDIIMSNRDQKKQGLTKRIIAIYDNSDKRYGDCS